MLIRVLRFRGRSPDTVTEATFSEEGGTIGRSSNCTLVLSDPDRHISRIQAEINCAAGRFILTDRGSANPVQRNGTVIGTGKIVPLQDGDELHMGDYVLRVELEQVPSTAPQDPFGDLIAPSAPAAMPGDHPLSPGAGSADGLIPDDFDLLGGKSRYVPDPVHQDSVRRPGQSIDELFGLGASMSDPLAVGSPFGPPAAQANMSGAADPLSSLQAPPDAPGAPIRDDAPELYGQFRLPEAAPGAAFRSWENPGGISKTLIVAKNKPAGGKPSLSDSIPRSGVQSNAGAEDETAMTATGYAGSCDEAGLLAAFLEGAGLQELPRDPKVRVRASRELDVQTMYRLGALLRVFSQGTVQLLATRATLKSEMRAEVTIIATERNNPLKFSPDSSAVMQHLLALHTIRGFMEPEEAVRDAMTDLAAHQVGVIAGMRAALNALLERFQPDELEKRLTGHSMLDSMLPMNRKAKLWERFAELYGEISREAEDDFEALFGREFVRAYEAQIDKLASDDAEPT